ncbi:hypothetical protein BDZ89DRAFT_564027 [Hymenopellis radicata]|nr:hypothetical protein BDZ89DRAFT_564027 [Hymenopellis radicata]
MHVFEYTVRSIQRIKGGLYRHRFGYPVLNSELHRQVHADNISAIPWRLYIIRQPLHGFD